MVAGLLWALMAGALVGFQNIFNSKTQEYAGAWPTTVLVLGMGFAASLLMGIITQGFGGMFSPKPMETWYWFSGIIGVGVVLCLTQAIRLLGPTFATSLVLFAQLGSALVLDSLGWMGLQKVELTSKQIIGVLVIAVGIAVFKRGGKEPRSGSSFSGEAVPLNK